MHNPVNNIGMVVCPPNDKVQRSAQRGRCKRGLSREIAWIALLATRIRNVPL